MILVGVGANLAAAGCATPLDSCRAAVAAMAGEIGVTRRSSWYRSAPVPPSDQAWFVNGVVALETAAPPAVLLAQLHDIEGRFGRERRRRNEPRVLDLDLLDYHGRVQNPVDGPVLPHPRMHERAFVLVPLCELDAAWRHPVLGLTAATLRRRWLQPGQEVAWLAAG